MKGLFSRFKSKIKETLKTFNVFDYFIMVAALYTFILYLFYFLGGTAFSDSGGIFVSSFVLLGTTLPFFFRRYLKKYLKKVYSPFKIIYGIVLLAYTVSFTMISALLLFDTEKPLEFDERPAVVVVCGCKTYAEWPSKTLSNRIWRAYLLLEEHPDAICIATGGQGADEPITESSMIKKTLVKYGIDESRIIEENRSTDTVENLKYTLEILESMGIGRNCNLICVSSDVHTARVAIIARQMGFDAQTASAKSPDPFHLVASLVREYMSFIKYYLIG